MGRVIPDTEPEIFFAGAAKATTSTEKKTTTYSERLVKYIPAEVLAGYIFAGSLISSINSPTGRVIYLVVLIVLCLIAIPIQYQKLIERGKRARKHMFISELAFLAWAYGIGGPFAVLGWHHPAMAGLILVAFTFLAPWFEP